MALSKKNNILTYRHVLTYNAHQYDWVTEDETKDVASV